MIDILQESRKILESSGYTIRQFNNEEFEYFGFEDSRLIGICILFSSIDDMVRNWRDKEQTVFDRYKFHLFRADEKLWNFYSIFVCSAEPDDTQRKRICKIEQNIETSRKIAATGIKLHHDLENAFLRIMPIKNIAQVPESSVQERFNMKIWGISPELAEEFYNSKINIGNVKKILRVL